MARRTKADTTPTAPITGPERIHLDLLPLAVPIDTVRLDPANLKQHGTRSLEAIGGSLDAFEQLKPIVVDGDGVCIAGNGTLEAALQRGWKRIAVVRAKHLVGAQRTAYAVADNRTAEHAAWNEEALKGVLLGMDAELRAAAGYTDRELADLMTDDSKPMAEDDVPAILPAAVARPGEIWQLGSHRLMCGDSTSLEDVRRLMGDEKAALVATDPPYLVEYTGERPDGAGKDWSETYIEVETGEADRFFRLLFKNILAVIAPHAGIYCWHAHKLTGTIQRIWEDLDILDHQQIVWVKPTPLLGNCVYLFQHEPCIVGWRRGSKPPHDGRHDVTTVWVVPWDPYTTVVHAEEADVWKIDWEGKARPVKNEHPTQKPLEIFARPIRKHTKPGDVLFEPFSGSGSQLIAAHRLGRRLRAMELSPVFVDVAIRRWQNEALEPARLITAEGPSLTWDEARAQRLPEGPAAPGGPPAAASPRRSRSKGRRTEPSTASPPQV